MPPASKVPKRHLWAGICLPDLCGYLRGCNSLKSRSTCRFSKEMFPLVVHGQVKSGLIRIYKVLLSPLVLCNCVNMPLLEVRSAEEANNSLTSRKPSHRNMSPPLSSSVNGVPKLVQTQHDQQDHITINGSTKPHPSQQGQSSPSLGHSVLSLSSSSIANLIPSLYNLGVGANYSMPSMSRNNSDSNFHITPSDELARASDVTVSTNVISQAEYKGFAGYVASGIFLFVWIGWSILPDSILNSMGIYYYPSRWWALAIPSYVLMLMIYTYIALALYNINVKTVKLDDYRTIVDDSGIIITSLEDYQRENLSDYLYSSTSGVWDIPLTEVNNVLYNDDM